MTWRLDIENIGGIRSGAAAIEPGINTVRASNWQGKSSLVKAIETAMGTATTLTEGTERGRVQLVTDDGTIEAELSRQNGEVVRQGDAYLPDERDRVRAELFAFLDEDNEVRETVRTGRNLEPVLTRPLDFERIDERIAELREEREQVETEYERSVAAADRLPAVQERVTTLESELEELREERAELTTADPGTESATKRDDLSEARAERERLENRKAQLEKTIASTRNRLDARREELDEVAVPEAGEFEADIADARDELSRIEQELDLLQSLYNANKRVLDAGRVDILTDIEHGLVGDSLTCWVCGEDVERGDVETQLDKLADRLADRRQDAEEYRAKVDELEAARRSIREKRRKKQDLAADIDDLEATLAEREASLETVTDRLEAVAERIDGLESEVEASDDRLTDVESEIKFKEAELEDAREELETVEQRADQRSTLEEERASLVTEIEELRTRKERLKSETREAFEDAMEAIIDRLEPGFERARLTANFELVVARDGREASLDALSEGEVELLGIITALSGFEAYDVGETVPVILLDSVGDLAGETLDQLVSYLADRTTYLVSTAYPEQAVAEDHVIDPTDWSVVSSDVSHEASS